MTWKLRLAALAMVIAVSGTFVAGPLASTAAPNRGGSATLTGSGVDANGVAREFSWALSDLSATVDETGAVLISGTVTDAAGAMDTFTGQALQSASCDILNLVLGPLDLNLLGLQIDLAQIVLDITAVPGPGNLLGNLLCAVAALLDSGGPGGAIANLLNRLFGLLG